MQKERHDEAMGMQKKQDTHIVETLHTQNHRLICVADVLFGLMFVLFGLMFVKLTKMEERHDKAMGMQKERHDEAMERLDTIDRSMTTLEGSHRDSQTLVTLVSTQLDAHEERLQVMQLAVIKARAKTFDIPTPP